MIQFYIFNQDTRIVRGPFTSYAAAEDACKDGERVVSAFFVRHLSRTQQEVRIEAVHEA